MHVHAVHQKGRDAARTKRKGFNGTKDKKVGDKEGRHSVVGVDAVDLCHVGEEEGMIDTHTHRTELAREEDG